MGVKDYAKALKMMKEFEKLESHVGRVFVKIDEEMYLISKSEKDKNKLEEAQRNLAVFIIADLLDSFEKKEARVILDTFKRTFE